MSSMENTEVYIPKNVHVKNVPVQFLPSSINRKICMHPVISDARRSVNSSSPTAMWISPVELREKGATTCAKAQIHLLLTPGQLQLPIISSSAMASKILRKFLYSKKKNSKEISDPDVPVVCSRLSSHRQHAVVIYDGHIFLTLKRKRMEPGLLDSQSLAVPILASQRHLIKTPPLSSGQLGSPEEHKCGEAPDSCSHNDPPGKIMGDMKEKDKIFSDALNSVLHKGISDPIQRSQHIGGEGQVENDGGPEPMGREVGCPSNKECVLNVENGVLCNDEPIEEMEVIDQGNGQTNGEDNQSFMKDVNMASNNNELSAAGSGELQIVMDTEHNLENGADGHVAEQVVQKCTDNDQSSPSKVLRSDLEGLPVISHITSLAEGWNNDVKIEYDGFSINSEEPEALQSCSSAGGELLEPLQHVSAEVSVHGRTLKNGAVNGLDFDILMKEEHINHMRGKLNKLEEKLKTFNTQQ